MGHMTPALVFKRRAANRTTPRAPCVDERVVAMLARDPVVAISVSGGRDSVCCALAVSAYLDDIGFAGERVLVHADLGSVEWKDSIRCCREVAQHLGVELIVVEDEKGGLLGRWQRRWAGNLVRYQELSCVRMILPWSTSRMRFCTSDSKVRNILRVLKARYPGRDMLNVVGIRHQESAARSKMHISAENKALSVRGAQGVTWNGIIEFVAEDVIETICQAGLALHEAYTRYLASRVSCVYCVLASEANLKAAAACEENRGVYRDVVDLKIDSRFAFQGNRWLADIAPHLLTSAQRDGVARAKCLASARQKCEARIPAHLLYCEGWPISLPSVGEAKLLASVRRDVSALYGIEVAFDTGAGVRDRYAQLLALKALKDAKDGALL